MAIQEIDMATYRPQVKKILVLGDYGAGKTHFLGTFPKPVLLFSFDRGYDTIAMTPGIKVINVMEADREKPRAWLDFNLRFAKFKGGEKYKWPDGKEERYKSVCFDGLTFLTNYCMNHYQFMGSNVNKKATYTQYQQVLENIGDVINQCRYVGEFVGASVLIKVEKDDLTGEVLALPNMTGSIRDQMGAHFDGVFYMYVDRKADGREVYAMKTVGGYREKGKIRVPSDIKKVIKAIEIDPDFAILQGKIATEVDKVYGDLPQPTAEPVTVAPAPQKPQATAPSAPKGPIPKPITPQASVPQPKAPGPVAPTPAAPKPAPTPKAAPAPTAKPVSKYFPHAKGKSSKSGFRPPTPKIAPRVR